MSACALGTRLWRNAQIRATLSPRAPPSNTADRKLASKTYGQRVSWEIALAVLALTACSGRAERSAIAIIHVSVIDVASGTTRQDNTVVVTGNRITYAGPAASAAVPAAAKVIEGQGKFLIPGLWDMHVHGFVHKFSDFAGPLMIANGVTGAREMGYYIDTTLRWKSDIAAGREIGPRLIAGVRVDGAVTRARYIAHVSTEDDGMRAVDTLARTKDGSRRADFIKTYSWVPRAAYFGIAREAKKLSVPFAGHVPYSVSVVEASDAGQRSIEHEDDLMRACTSKDSLLRARLGDTTGLAASGWFSEINAQARVIQTSFDPARCKSVIATLARNHTWVTPTLIVYQPQAHAFDSARTHPEWSKYVPAIVRAGWRRRKESIPPRDSVVARSYFSLGLTRDLRDQGVKLLAGTDTPQPFVYPGLSLHEELELLVRAGLTPMEAIRSATYNPAEFLGALDSLGTVDKGKVADLVLLDADPLTDIRNTRRISLVIANGRVFDRSALRAMLNRVEAALKH